MLRDVAIYRGLLYSDSILGNLLDVQDCYEKTKHSKTHLFIPVDSPIISAHIWDLSPPTTSGLSSEGRTSFQNANTSHVPSLASRKNGYCQWHLGGVLLLPCYLGWGPVRLLYFGTSRDVCLFSWLRLRYMFHWGWVIVPNFLVSSDFRRGKSSPTTFGNANSLVEGFWTKTSKWEYSIGDNLGIRDCPAIGLHPYSKGGEISQDKHRGEGRRTPYPKKKKDTIGRSQYLHEKVSSCG